METFIELFLKNGLRPLQFYRNLEQWEKDFNRSELTTLMMLHHRGELSMSDLAHELGVPMSTLTNVIRRLLGRELIIRERNEKDRRVYMVSLSPKGIALAEQMWAQFDHMFQKVQAALTPQELQQFVSLSLKVGKAIQQDIGTPNDTSAAEVKKISIED
jgi:DNA-binding MarR family transcriptional regulator